MNNLYKEEQKLLQELAKNNDKQHQAALKRQITRINKSMETLDA